MEFEDEDKWGNIIKIKALKMRNPWSKEKFKGKLSDKDKKFWDRNRRKELKHRLTMHDGIFYMTFEEFKKNMLYVVVSNYHEGWNHNYITNTMDDGKKHYFLFDVKPGEEGTHYVKVDHFDTRMYPYLTKVDKIMSHYALFKYNITTKVYDKIVEDFGSDWIGFQEEEVELTAGMYKVEVLIKWVKNSVRDYTLGLYSENKVTLYECIGYGLGD